jgi:hypothetical protein
MNEGDNAVPLKRSIPVLVGAWLIVAVPAGWGVAQTVRRSLALFHSAQAPPAVRTSEVAAPDRAGH